MAQDIKAYKQYIFKDGQFRKTSGGGGAEIRVVDELPEVGEPNVLYVLDGSSPSPTPTGGVANNDIIIDKFEWQMGNNEYPRVHITSKPISDTIYNLICTTDRVRLRLNSLGKGRNGLRLTVRDNFQSQDGWTPELINLYLKYHAPVVTEDMVKENKWGQKYIDILIDLGDRTLSQLEDFGATNVEKENYYIEAEADSVITPTLIQDAIKKGLPHNNATQQLTEVYNNYENSFDVAYNINKPISDLAYSKWFFDGASFTSRTFDDTNYFEINFESNNESFTSITISRSNSVNTILFDNTTVYSDGVWLADAYKAIIIISGSDTTNENLIEWLQKYAIQSPEIFNLTNTKWYFTVNNGTTRIPTAYKFYKLHFKYQENNRYFDQESNECITVSPQVVEEEGYPDLTDSGLLMDPNQSHAALVWQGADAGGLKTESWVNQDNVLHYVLVNNNYNMYTNRARGYWVTITGGEDVTNQELITWLKENAQLADNNNFVNLDSNYSIIDTDLVSIKNTYNKDEEDNNWPGIEGSILQIIGLRNCTFNTGFLVPDSITSELSLQTIACKVVYTDIPMTSYSYPGALYYNIIDNSNNEIGKLAIYITTDDIVAGHSNIGLAFKFNSDNQVAYIKNLSLFINHLLKAPVTPIWKDYRYQKENKKVFWNRFTADSQMIKTGDDNSMLVKSILNLRTGRIHNSRAISEWIDAIKDMENQYAWGYEDGGINANISPLINAFDFKISTQHYVRIRTNYWKEIVRDVISPSFGILVEDWGDKLDTHIWEHRYSMLPKYLTIKYNERITIIVDEEDSDNVQVSSVLDVKYKISNFVNK